MADETQDSGVVPPSGTIGPDPTAEHGTILDDLAPYIAANGGIKNRVRSEGTGKFIKGQASMARDAEAFRLRSLGWTYQRISDHLGYGGQGNVYRALKNVMREHLAPAIDEYRSLMDAQLDELHAAALKVMDTKHLKVNNGEIVRVDGEPVEDDAPILQAIQTVMKVLERRAKLWGLDAPVKSEVGLHGVHYTVDGVDMDKV